jgi:hypothetical protein
LDYFVCVFWIHIIPLHHRVHNPVRQAMLGEHP